MIKAAFLDRDGVINEEVNYLHKISDFRYTNNCIAALKIIQNLGYKIIIVTNQAGIAKGIFKKKDYDLLTSWLLDDLLFKGIEILDCLHCPHHPEGIISAYSHDCKCRKPDPGMILHAVEKYQVDIESSFLVGDKESDIQAAKNSKLGSYYLVESGHRIPKSIGSSNIIKRDLYHVATDLLMRM